MKDALDYLDAQEGRLGRNEVKVVGQDFELTRHREMSVHTQLGLKQPNVLIYYWVVSTECSLRELAELAEIAWVALALSHEGTGRELRTQAVSNLVERQKEV